MKGKKIELKDITSNPLVVIGIMSFVCVLLVVGIVFLMLDIDSTKQEIKDVRIIYEANVREVALLEELKIKSEAAEAQLEACNNILPEKLGDVYLLEEEVIEKCKLFGLDVVSISHAVAVNETQEVVFTISATASYGAIYDYMNYYSNLEQVHRFDSISLARNTDGTYNTSFALAFLSEQGAEGAVQAAVGDAVQQAVS
jgi:Na+-translocating ferredoxin:NAD+ oxidoreductase RnfG subunit